MKTYWIVQLEPDTWIAPWSGDPGRCTVVENAKRFASVQQARAALMRATKWGPFPDAIIETVEAEVSE